MCDLELFKNPHTTKFSGGSSPHMSGRLFLVSKSVLQHLLGVDIEFAKVVVGVFLFPFCPEELTIEVIAGLRLARVESLLLSGELILSLTCLLLNCWPRGTTHA